MPDNLKNQKQAAIYLTDFDQDGFLEFKLLAGENSKNGIDAQVYRLVKSAYRALWKEEFEKIEFKSSVKTEEIILSGQELVDRGLLQAIELTKEGIEKVNNLKEVVNNPRTRPEILKSLNTRINQIDKEIEQVGLSNPILGAMIRIFLMEKENIRGDNISDLASDNMDAYQRLLRRSQRFAGLYKHFQDKV